jgi:hypothetical protein
MFEWAYSKQSEHCSSINLEIFCTSCNGPVIVKFIYDCETLGLRWRHALKYWLHHSCKGDGCENITLSDSVSGCHLSASSYMELKLRCDHINFKVSTNDTFIYMPDSDNIPANFAQWASEQQLEINHDATSLGGPIITRDNQRGTTESLAKKLAEIDRTCDQLCSE